MQRFELFPCPGAKIISEVGDHKFVKATRYNLGGEGVCFGRYEGEEFVICHCDVRVESICDPVMQRCPFRTVDIPKDI